MKKSNDKSLEKLHRLAVKVRKNAHAPYSHFQVGSALVTEDGNYYAGCNVENASYGGTICAERSAIFTAVSHQGAFRIKDILVVTAHHEAWPPCGFCRQVISEFSTAKTLVHIADENKIQKSYLLSKLLPEAFGSSNLTKSKAKKN